MAGKFQPPDFKKDTLKIIIEKAFHALTHEFNKIDEKFSHLWEHLHVLKTDHEIEKKMGGTTEKSVSDLHKKHDTLDKKVDDLDVKVAKIDGKQIVTILMLIGGLGLLGAILGFTVFK